MFLSTLYIMISAYIVYILIKSVFFVEVYKYAKKLINSNNKKGGI